MTGLAGRIIRRTAVIILTVVVAGWLGICALLWATQTSYIYPASPYRNEPMHAFGRLKPATLTDADGTVLRYAQVAPQLDMPVIIFYHGNGDWVIPEGAEYMQNSLENILNGLAGQGYGVVAAEFRGYAGIPGVRSESNIIHDARSYVTYVRNKWPSSKIILWGMSMGAGTALAVAADMPVEGLILDSPFTSIRAIAQKMFTYIPVSMLLTSPFDSMERLSRVKVPVYVMHGNRDTVIPVAMGHEVLEAAACPVGSLFLPDAAHTAITTDTTGRAAEAVRNFAGRIRYNNMPPCGP